MINNNQPYEIPGNPVLPDIEFTMILSSECGAFTAVPKGLDLEITSITRGAQYLLTPGYHTVIPTGLALNEAVDISMEL